MKIKSRYYYMCDRFGVPWEVGKKKFYEVWRFYKIVCGRSEIVIRHLGDCEMINLYHDGKQVLYYFTK